MRRPLLLVLTLAACGGGAATPDGGGAPDGHVAVDGGRPDAAAPDAALDAAPTDASLVPLPGFGTITGSCGVLGESDLTGTTPELFAGDLDFGTDRYDDPADRSQLTPGGQILVTTPNAGGSSSYSETFAFEVLARCELADLVKTETELHYVDPNSKRADILVMIDGHPVGVSVVRAVTYPFGDPYTLADATTVITGKIDDIVAAQADAVPEDHWDKSIVVALAYDAQHADVLAQAWAALAPTVQRDVIVLVYVTDGDDLFIYTNV